MRPFGSISELVSVVFRKDTFQQTLRPSQTVSYTADRDIQLPPQNANSVLVSADSTQTLTNKTISGASNTISSISLTASVSGILPAANGGTGVNNSGTLTLGSNNITLTTSGVTSVTLPASGTLATLSGSETLANKTLANTSTILVKDSLLSIQDDGDATKVAQFQVSGLTTGTTRTFTFPDVSMTLAGRANTETLSNKTLDDTTSISIKDTAFNVESSGDATKIARFSATGISTGTTRTFSLPNATTTLVGTDTTQTLTNKTLDGGSNTLSNISLTGSVTGVLPIANGGTNASSKTPAFDNLSPTTTKGDLIANNGTNNIRFAVGADGTVLTASSGAASGLSWATPLTNPMTTVGDIIVGGTAGAATRLAIGASGTVLHGGTTPGYSQIVNADVDSAAAIAFSKLASLTSAQILVGNGSNVATSVAVTGDVTISNAGVTAIGSSKVTSAMIVDGTIVDGDISASAAIAGSKLVAASASVAGAVTTGSQTFAGLKNLQDGLQIAGNTFTYTPPTAYTPVLSTSGTAMNVTYTTQTGYYTRIGNMVICTIFMRWSNNTAVGTGDFMVSLPLTSQSSSTSFQAAAVGTMAHITLPAGFTWMSGVVNPGAATMNMEFNGSTQTSASSIVTSNNIATGLDRFFATTVTYFV